MNKRTINVFVVLVIVGLTASCRQEKAVEEPEPSKPTITGEEIIAKVREELSNRDYAAVIKISFASDSGESEELVVQVYHKQFPEHAATFMQVMSPPSEKKQAMLVTERPGQKTDVASYMAGLRRVIRFSTNRRLYYKGLSISIQEMIGGELYNYDHQLLGAKQLDSVETYHVESRLKPNAESDYPRLVGYYRQDNFMPLEIELYNRQNQLERTMRVAEWMQVSGHWGVKRAEVADAVANRHITLETVDLKYDPALPDELFTEEHLIETITRAVNEIMRQSGRNR